MTAKSPISGNTRQNVYMKTVLALFVLAVVGSAAQADLQSDARSMNNQMTSALKKMDVKSVEKITKQWCSPNFKYTELGRTQTRQEMVTDIKMSFTQIKNVLVSESKIKKITQKGNSGTTTGTHHMVCDILMPDKKTHKLDYFGISTDVWAKNGKKWQVVSMSMMNLKMTLDGKPFDPSKMGGGN